MFHENPSPKQSNGQYSLQLAELMQCHLHLKCTCNCYQRSLLESILLIDSVRWCIWGVCLEIFWIKTRLDEYSGFVVEVQHSCRSSRRMSIKNIIVLSFVFPCSVINAEHDGQTRRIWWSCYLYWRRYAR